MKKIFLIFCFVFLIFLPKTLFGQSVTENLVVQYMGNNTANMRIAAIARITLSGLTNGVSYDFRVAGSTTGVGTYCVFDGANGNGLITSPTAGGTYSTNVFTASGNSKTLWVLLFPSSNVAFASAATIKLTYYLRVNGGSVVINATQGQNITCLNFASGGNAALLKGTPEVALDVQGKFVFAWDNVDGIGWPLVGYIAENNAVTEASYPAAYSTTVGDYGFLIPSSNPNGIRRLEVFSGNGNSFAANTSESGFTGTVNPTANSVVTITSIIAPLPVELSSFSALPKANAVQLTWATATEINNFGFEIERSQKLVVSSESTTWQSIGFVKGNGNSNSPREYSYTDNTLSNSGKYVYRLKQIDNDGTVTYSNEIETDVTVVLEYGLSQNYPNPFNPATVINYTLAEPGFVTIKVYNMLGEEVTTLINGQMEAGKHTLQFSATGGASKLSSGMYLYKITAGNFTQVKKMLLTK